MFSEAVENMWNVKATLINTAPCEHTDKCSPLFNANLSSVMIFLGMQQKIHKRNRKKKKLLSAGQIFFFHLKWKQPICRSCGNDELPLDWYPHFHQGAESITSRTPTKCSA